MRRRDRAHLWGRNDMRTHITEALVWAHDTYRPGRWHLIVGVRVRRPVLTGYEVPTACGRALVDSYGYGVEETRSGQPVSSTPGGHRWRGVGLPPVGRGRTEGVCRRCASTFGIA